ncbi:hypothetical protein GCM10011575_18920 [Microlunatus endophyticus]|uniref:Uncharacterized protein n=1 Tax=Microlunatus endophyticus TaxID=1716077 RepID=A0A917S6J5_9ACTN|nr:hypothetical protein GCM10011575_18920 [Microlunatus endophyticus]
MAPVVLVVVVETEEPEPALFTVVRTAPMVPSAPRLVAATCMVFDVGVVVHIVSFEVGPELTRLPAETLEP